jgi:hypothetical protein
LRLSSITIDADGSPSGYIAWYNHSTDDHKIQLLRPSPKNEKYGVQRMEMLAIYFALVENQHQIGRIAKSREIRQRQGQHQQQLVVNIRSDSKTSIEQLRGISQVRDAVLQRICSAIKKLHERLPYMIIFHHLERNRNIAGLLLEQRRRKEEEKSLIYQYEKYYYPGITRLRELMITENSHVLTTA